MSSNGLRHNFCFLRIASAGKTRTFNKRMTKNTKPAGTPVGGWGNSRIGIDRFQRRAQRQVALLVVHAIEPGIDPLERAAQA